MNIKKISSYLIKILIITIFIILSTMQFVAKSAELVNDENIVPEGVPNDPDTFYEEHTWGGTRGLGTETVKTTVWDYGYSGILCDDEGIKIGDNPAQYKAIGGSAGNAFTAFIHAHSDIYRAHGLNYETARKTQRAWWQFRFNGVPELGLDGSLLENESGDRISGRPDNSANEGNYYMPKEQLTNQSLLNGAKNSVESGLSGSLKDTVLDSFSGCDKPSELYSKLEELHNNGQISESDYQRVNDLISEGYESAVGNSRNEKEIDKNTGEWGDSTDVEIEDHEGYEHDGYEYSKSYVGADDLYSWATQFYKYAEIFLDEGNLNEPDLKKEYKPKIVTKKADGLSEDAKISFDKQSQCYIIGPIKLIYPYYEYNEKLFAGITEAKLSYTNTDGSVTEVERTQSDINGLSAGQWNYLLKKPENLPKCDEEVYIALKYGENIKSISNMHFKTKYLTFYSGGWTEWEGTEKITVEKSKTYRFTYKDKKKDYSKDGPYKDSNGTYDYETIWPTATVTVTPKDSEDLSFVNKGNYTGIVENSITCIKVEYDEIENTTQPLTTPHQNYIHYKEDEASMDFPTPMDDLVLTKKAVDKDGNVIESDDEFNFQVWIEDDGTRTHEKTQVFDGKTYYLWRSDVVVRANQTTTVDMPYYYPENYSGKPGVVIVETDSMGITYSKVKEIKDLLDREDAKVLKEALRNLGIDVIKPDSIWLSGGYTVPDEIDGLGAGVTYKGDGVYILNGGSFEVTAVNVKDQHGHLSITKKMRKEYYRQDEEFNMSLELTIDGETITEIIPLKIQKDNLPYVYEHSITLKDGTVIEGVVECSEDDTYYYATWTSGEIKWNSANPPTYRVEEKLTEIQDEEYTVVGTSNTSGYISKCNQEHSSDILSGDYKVEAVEVEIENAPGGTTILTELEKEVVDQDGNPNEIEIDRKYLVDITYTGDIDGERVELGDSYTVEISPKGIKGKYSISKRPEVEQYYVRIDEHENTDGSFWKDFEAVYANGETEEPISEEDIEIVYEKDQYGADTEKIDYIEIKIDSEKINSFKIKLKVKNTMSFTGLTLQKSCPDFEALKKLGIDTFYFLIEPVSINYFKRPFGLDTSFYETYKDLFDDDRYLKDENGNLYKDKAIVMVTEADGFVLDSNVIPFTSIPLQITEVDQFGVAYSDFDVSSYDSEEDYENSIWNLCHPTDGEGYNFYRFKQYAKESDIPFGEEPVTAVFANEKEDSLDVKLKIKKKLSSYSGEASIEEFFEENPNFEFRFKVFAEINFDYYDMAHIHSDGDGMENYEDITSEYFGSSEVVINKSNYADGVISKKIPTDKYTGRFIVKEILDNGESGLFRPNGNNTFDTWLVDANSVESEDPIPTVEVEAENIVGRIQLDKNIEPFEAGEEFYFRMFENDEDVTEKYFGTSKVTITKAIHDQGGIVSSNVYGNHEFTIVEYDDKDFKYEDRAKSDSDYWDLFIPENDGTWTFTMAGEDLNEEAIRLIEAKNYKDRRIQVRKTISSSIVSNSDKTYYFDVYVKGEDIKYGTGSNVGSLNSPVITGEMKELEGYQKLTTLQTTVRAGETTSEWVSTDYIRFSGDKISYKVIEVDENGVSYSQYKSNPSEYTGTLWNNNIVPENNGVWSGTLNKEITKREGEVEKIEAVNSDSKPDSVSISLTKSVINKDGKLEPIAEGEKFIYNIEVTGYGTERVEITKEHPTWNKVYVIKKGESLKVTATEVDEQGRTYENRGDSEFWKEFVPADGKGIITKEVNGSNVNINLEGTNIKKSRGKLKIIKEKKPFVEGEKFYFTINNLSQAELANMFSSAETTTVGGKGAIVLTYSNPIAVSNDIDWQSIYSAPTYTITEVDENGNAYGDLTEEQKAESKIWSVNNPEDGGVHTVTLQSNSESSATVTTCVQLNNSERYSFTIKKEVKNDSLDVTDESIVENHKEFYFKVIDVRNNKPLSEDELKDILEEDCASYVKTLPNNIAVVVLNENNYSEGIISKKIDKSLQYKIVEVDDKGDEYSETSASEYWKEFTPERTEWIASEKSPNVIAINYSNDNYWAQVNVSKLFNGNWKEGDYEVLVEISTDGGKSWDTLKSFTFNPTDHSGKYVTGNPEEIDSDNYDARLTWKQGDTAPKVRFRETTETGKKVTYRINDERVEENTEYQLSDGKGMQCSLECTNGVSTTSDRHYGSILVKKSFNSNANISFTFKYQYKRAGGDWGPEKTLIVPANGMASTEVISWDDGEDNPEFRIWEVEDSDYTIKSVDIVNSDKVDNAQKYNSNGVQGKLNCTKHKTENQPQVEVSAVNIGNDHKGSLKILKKFNVIEEKEGVTVEDILSDLSAVSPGYQFKFVVNIYNENNTGSFTYNGVEYSNDNVARVEMSVSIGELLGAMSSYGKSTSEVQIGKLITVSWKGDKAPRFKVEEENTGKFWHGTVIDGSSTQFVEGKTIEVLFVNEYTVTTEMGLYTKLAGLVWEDFYNKDKDGSTDGIDADGVYELGEKLVDNVYVVPVRVLKNGSTEIRARNSDPDHGGFIKNATKDYYYISNSDNGRWHFENVEVPAKRSNEGSVDDVYYDIEFYYDGTLYEPTKFLAELGGNAETYKSLPTENKPEYFDNSFALESSDGNERKQYNAQFATVTGDQPFNGATDPDTVSTIGKVLDSKGNEKSYVDYKTVAVAGSGDNEVLRYISNGTLRILSPDNSESEDYINDTSLFMKATTENAGLTYFFGYDFALEEDMTRVVQPDGVHYYYGNKVLDIDYAEHINLGLIKRQRAEILVDKTIDSATIIVNDKYKTYYLNNNATTRESLSAIIKDLTKDLNSSDVFGNLQQYIDNDEVKSDLNIYQSDYNYRVAAYQGTPVATALDKFYQAINGGVENDAIKSKELKVFLTYKVKIKNASGDYDVKVKYLDDYYSADLTYVDVASGYNYMDGTIKDGNHNRDGHEEQPGLWAYIEQNQKEETNLTNVFAPDEKNPDKSDYYEKSIISDDIEQLETISTNLGTSYNKDRIDLNKDDKHGIKIASGKEKEYYLTYKVGNVNQFLADANGILFELGEKRNYAEVQEFTPYISGTKYKEYAGVLDRYSAPGSLNMQDYSTYLEQDTDFAIVDLISNPDETPRTISGTAWLDSEIEDNKFNNQTIGDGRLNIDGETEKPLEGYTARLVQVIDVPTVEDGTITDNYEEYEFYWDNANSVTDADGNYVIDGYTSKGIVNKGLMPGNFIVRFNYGDEYNEPGINGEDYKTTIYQVDGKLKVPEDAKYVNNEWIAEMDTDGYDVFTLPEDNNQFRDSEARRLKIIKDTYELDNDKTATFNVAGQTKEDYVDKMKTDYDNQIKDENYPDYAKQYEEFNNKLYQPLEVQQNGDYAYDNGRLTKADGYAMFADTAKMNLPVESPIEEAKEKSEGDLNAKTDGYEIKYVNFGLEERSKTEFYMDKQIEQIKLTTSSDKVFFNVNYDIHYYYGEEEGEIKDKDGNEPENTDENELYEVTKGIWVQIIPDGEVIGVSNLQSLRDKLEENNETTQGFKYINTDSIVLQGLTMNIRYKFTVFNLSETDTYGEKLDEILYSEENYINNEKIQEAFDKAITELSSPEYQITPDDEGHLNFRYEIEKEEEEGEGKEYSGPKSYGRYLGNTYYRGFNEGDSKWETDKVVTTTVRQMIDYVDNDIGVPEIGATQGEDGALWQIRENNEESLGEILDDNIFVGGQVYNEISTSNTPYNNILLTVDSKKYNSKFVKRLIPKDSELENNNHPIKPEGEEESSDEEDDPKYIDDFTVTTYLTETKEFSATDKGDTGIDNYAEIVLVENTVGRRDVETVYGNYDPRAGAKYTTERDESSTEIITLSPPTGNEENEREMWSWMSIVIAIALVAGGTTGISIGIVKKSKKQKYDDAE